MKKALLLAFSCSPAACCRRRRATKRSPWPRARPVAGSINAFNARLDIDGKVDESVFLVGGSLRLNGEVSGDVICIGSQVEIGDGAVIGRDLIVIGGQPGQGPGLQDQRRVLQYPHPAKT